MKRRPLHVRVIGYVAARHQMSKDREGIVYFDRGDSFTLAAPPRTADFRHALLMASALKDYTQRDVPLPDFLFKLPEQRLFDPVYRYEAPAPDSLPKVKRVRHSRKRVPSPTRNKRKIHAKIRVRRNKPHKR
jgi:hypothetical protein